jgi:hypothetical protein
VALCGNKGTAEHHQPIIITSTSPRLCSRSPHPNCTSRYVSSASVPCPALARQWLGSQGLGWYVSRVCGAAVGFGQYRGQERSSGSSPPPRLFPPHRQPRLFAQPQGLRSCLEDTWNLQASVRPLSAVLPLLGRGGTNLVTQGGGWWSSAAKHQQLRWHWAIEATVDLVWSACKAFGS